MLSDPRLLPVFRLIRGLRRLAGRVRRTGRTALPDADARLIAAAFDRRFYLARNPDVAAAGMDPLSHFLSFGWKEGRDPTADFSVRDYAELYPEVAEAGRNPFAHYLRSGRDEGRTTRRALGFRAEILAGLEPLDQRLRRARARWTPASAADPTALAAALQTSRSGLLDLHLSVSHDDYAAHVGGLQICVQREARALAALGVDHLHLYPHDTYPTVRDEAGGLLGVLWNGRWVGLFRPADLADVLQAAIPAQARRLAAIHSLLGHSVPDLLQVAAAAGIAQGVFWLHDFASLCAGFHLMRNDVTDCGAPPRDSPACRVCVYAPRRAAHEAAHRALFEALTLTVAAPSASALETWRRGTDLPHAAARVAPHAVLAPRPTPPDPAPGPLRVAYLGAAVAHKGWPVFQALAERFAEDPRYAFVQFGLNAGGFGAIQGREVAVSADRPDAMRDALEADGIDVALIWPLCRETFSFTAYEAVAAGCAVLTHPDTGNVAALVADGGHGRVLADEAALTQLFESGEVLALSRAHRRPEVFDLVYGGVTADLRADLPPTKARRRVSRP